MKTDEGAASPKAFFSYSWDSPEHRQWVADLADRLAAAGVTMTFDDWQLRPGDQLPAFMEQAVRESDFVFIVCTPDYKRKSDERLGGVGYEGNIITGELLTERNERKFVPILRRGTWSESAASWLKGKVYIDLRGDPYDEGAFSQLLGLVHGVLPRAPDGRPGQRPESIARQKLFVEFISDATRVFSLCAGRLALLERSGKARDLVMQSVDAELEQRSDNLSRLVDEISLFGTERLTKAAAAIHATSLGARATAVSVTLKEGFEALSKEFARELLSEFRLAVREEAGVR